MDLTQLFAASGIVGLFAATGVVLMQLLRQNYRLNASQATEIRELKADAVRCNRRVDILINACQRGGIEVPEEVWNGAVGIT